MGLCRTNVMLDNELWKSAIAAGKDDDRSGSWILNRALEAYLNKGKKKAKPKASTPAVTEPAVMFIPLNSGEHGVTQSDIDKYIQLYPAVDISAELRAMIGWCDANTQNRKTASGIKRFINAWLKRAQDKGGNGLGNAQQSGLSRVTQKNLNNLEGDW